MMYACLTCCGRWLHRRAPSALDRLARVAAFVAFDLLRFRRRLILRNLELAFGDEWTPARRVEVGRNSMRHFFLTVFEFLESVERDLLDEVTAEGVNHAQQALAEGRGVYVLCGHLGNWEAMGGAGTRFAAPTHALVKEVGKGGANRLVDELRRKAGFSPIYRKPRGAALKAIHRALGRNELVAFILDQARPGAPRIPFFGTPAKTQTSLAAIWRKTPRPVIPVSIRRLAPRRHVVMAWPPLDLGKTDKAEQDVLNLTAQFNVMLETMIRTAPEQYFWLHNRWKD